MFDFNDRLDASIMKPVAQVYVNVTPSLVQTGVRNFFGNISDMWSTLNNALQLKPAATLEGLARVGVNTILGLGGVMDWATKMDLEKHSEDFGQTLGHWGVGAGPYVVLPLFGPSTVRDALALDLDLRSNPLTRVRPVENEFELAALSVVDKRVKYLEVGEQLNEVALDRYSFVRDVFLQKRRSDVFDGDPPDEDDPDERE
jgi:phospholipid-binding lipoprotein MlaA